MTDFLSLVHCVWMYLVSWKVPARDGDKQLYEGPNETAPFGSSTNLYSYKGFMELQGNFMVGFSLGL